MELQPARLADGHQPADIDDGDIGFAFMDIDQLQPGVGAGHGVTLEELFAADALGRAGFDGAVDRHFWDRFGGALLLSLVDDGAYAAFGSGDDARATARLPSDAAAAALQGSVDIPATLRKMQGSEVSIFVARDLDFRSVYRLRPR